MVAKGKEGKEIFIHSLLWFFGVVGAAMSLFFTAVVMPWADWVSRQIIDLKVSTAVVARKLNISADELATMRREILNDKTEMALPQLPFAPKMPEEGKK